MVFFVLKGGEYALKYLRYKQFNQNLNVACREKNSLLRKS